MRALPLTDRQKGLTAAILTALCWSFLAIFLKYGLRFADPYSIVWYRMFVAFIAMLGWFLIKGKPAQLQVLSAGPGLLLVAALALAFNYLGFMQGINFTSPANAQIFIQLGPLLLAVAGLVFFRESLSAIQVLGFFLCILGFGLFFSDRLTQLSGQHDAFFKGVAWILAGAVFWALFASLQKRLLLSWRSSQINIYVYLVSSLIYLPLVNWQVLSELSWSLHLFYVFLGLNTLFAYGFLSVALRHLPATQVSPILTMNPLLTLVLIHLIDLMSWKFIPADPIGPIGYFGAIFAVTGTVLVLSRKKRLP